MFLNLPLVKQRYDNTPRTVLVNPKMIALVEDRGDHCLLYMGGPPVKVEATFAALENSLKAMGE